MKIKRFAVGDLQANGYIIYQKDGGDCYIIDPGYDPNRFIQFVDEHQLNVLGILLTHRHYDHVGAVKKIKELKNCPVYMHGGDVGRYKGDIDVVMEDGDIFMLEDEAIKVLHTPGHSEGSVCFFSDKSKVVFTGDTIFDTDIGRTDLEDGDPYKMLATMKNVVNAWDNDITIYPGHDESCSMKFVREMNAEFIGAMAM